MKSFQSVLLGCAISGLFCASGNAGDLLDSVLEKPGGFDQMCSISVIEQGIPLPLFHAVERHMIFVSDGNLAELRAHRAEVVPGLVRRLDAFDTEKTAAEFNVLYYKVIPGLDAVEALPALLRIEDRVQGMIATLENNPKAPLPSIAGEFGPPREAKQDASAQERTAALFQIRVEQRELLSVMLQLLRRQEFQPLLDSDFEKKYEDTIKARAQEKDLKDITTREQAKEKGYAFDPICNVPVGFMYTGSPSVPYSEKIRAQVRDFAEQFVKNVPPEKWKVNAE